MAYYRLYFFDAAGSIEQFREFELPHDMPAIQQAAEWRNHQAMELWTGTRMVKRWDQSPDQRVNGRLAPHLDRPAILHQSADNNGYSAG